MKRSKKTVFADRRKHSRLPIVHGILEPVDLAFSSASSPSGRSGATQPGILSDLAAGGMKLLTFLDPPHAKHLQIMFHLPNLGTVPIKGKISWVRGKGGVYMSGITFTAIAAKHKAKINLMAEDYAD